MNHRQSLKKNMAHRTSNTLGRYANVYSGIPMVVSAVKEFDDTLAQINTVATERIEVSVPTKTVDKRNAEARMLDRVVPIANALYVIDFIAENTELTNLQGLSDNSFYRLTDSNKVPLAQRVLLLARKYTEELSGAGYDEAKIDEAETSVEDYQKVIANPMNAITVRKQKTTNIKELFASLDSILYDKLDKLMLLFKNSHPDFYDEYRTSRNVIEPSGSTVKDK
jgi:hypothetical protein